MDHWRFRFVEVTRDVHETWIVFIVCLMVHWTQWHARVGPPPPPLVEQLSDLDMFTYEPVWADVFFCAAFLCFILPYRYMWAIRYRPKIRFFLILLEILILIHLLEWFNRTIWQPVMGVFDAVQQFTFLYIEESCEHWRLVPGLFNWLVANGPQVFRLMVSVVCFFTAMETAGKNWIRYIVYLERIWVPEGQNQKPARHCTFKISNYRRNMYNNSPHFTNTRRYCRACMAEMK